MNDIGLLLLTPKRELAAANSDARALLGCSGVRDLERRWEEFRSMWDEPLARLEGAGCANLECDATVRTQTGPRRLRMSLHRLKAAEGEMYMVVLEPSENMEALHTDLLDATQLRALSHLSPTMAHDLKGPLNTMAINLELLHQSIERPDAAGERTRERQRRYVAALQQEIPRLNGALETFLTQLQPNGNARERFDLREVIHRVESLAAPRARLQHVTVRFDAPERPVCCHGSPAQIKQALVNIVVNALESMPKGGDLRVGLQVAGHVAQIAVRDSGSGLDEVALRRLGSLHVTTKGSSTGIGLYVAYTVIRSHGGSVTVSSQPGQGTCVEIVLPLVSEEN